MIERRRTALALIGAALLAGAGRPGRLAAHSADAAAHPAADYRRAAELMRAGRRDEATYWFYRGQYRFRVHLAARPDLARDGDPALFASLNEVVGRPINEWAFGDVPELLRILDRVLADATTGDDPYTPRARFPAAHTETLAGFRRFRDQVAASRDDIRRQREANGLPNRG